MLNSPANQKNCDEATKYAENTGLKQKNSQKACPSKGGFLPGVVFYQKNGEKVGVFCIIVNFILGTLTLNSAGEDPCHSQGFRNIAQIYFKGVLSKNQFLKYGEKHI